MYLQTQWEPMPHRRLFGLAGTRLEAIVKRRGEGIDSLPEALLPTQAVLKSNTRRYQLLNDTPRARECTLGEQGGT
jgi:hypothetical protein